MKLTIKSLKLLNFKGIREQEIDFSSITTISGRNEAGKTTVFDAFTWLIFGKDSIDRQAFEIKTLNPDGSPIHHLDHEVTGVIVVDGVETTLRRSLREKWVTKRGSSEKVFEGHETSFYKNDVPMADSEYRLFIGSIIEESKFKLLTNPDYFNSLKWEVRRQMLLEIAGEISDQEITQGDSKLNALLTRLSAERKTVEELQKEYAAKKKAIQKEIDGMEPRIKEKQRDIKEMPGDPDSIREKIDSINDRIANVNSGFNEAREKINTKKQRTIELEAKIQQLESVIKKSVAEKITVLDDNRYKLLGESNRLISERESISRQIDTINTQTEETNRLREQTRDAWYKTDAMKFSIHDDQLLCQSCGQELPADRRQVAERNFNDLKIMQLAKLTKEGKELKAKQETDLKEALIKATERLETVKAEIIRVNKELSAIDTAKEKIQSAQEVIKADPEIKKLETEMQAITSEILVMPDDTEIRQLQDEAKGYQEQLTQCEVVRQKNEEANQRIAELQSLWKNLSQEKASLEQIEFDIEKFITNKVNIVENRVNSKFDGVSFRMFDIQINGGQKPGCETLVNGVPYSDANHAGKINAGISIIKTFSRELGIIAPVWIDNAEAVNNILSTEGQMILLYVTTEPKLTITNQF